MGPKTPFVAAHRVSGHTGSQVGRGFLSAGSFRPGLSGPGFVFGRALFFDIVVCYGRDAQAAVLG